MAKKVLMLTGSPRKDGNSNMLATAFASGAKAAGNEVKCYNATKHPMKGCQGDGSCLPRGYCGVPEVKEFHELMCWADVLVIVSPVYWKGFSSQIKTIIDHLRPYAGEAGRALCTVHESYLIATARIPAEVEDAFSALKDEFEHINHVLKFKDCGHLLVGGVNEIGDIKTKPEAIAQAITMGFQI